MLSSEHYDVPDDDHHNPDESPATVAATAAGVGSNGGASGDGSEEGGRVGAGRSAGAAAGEVGGKGPEILIRPPSYGFNDKVSVSLHYLSLVHGTGAYICAQHFFIFSWSGVRDQSPAAVLCRRCVSVVIPLKGSKRFAHFKFL